MVSFKRFLVASLLFVVVLAAAFGIWFLWVQHTETVSRNNFLKAARKNNLPEVKRLISEAQMNKTRKHLFAYINYPLFGFITVQNSEGKSALDGAQRRSKLLSRQLETQ